MQFKRSSISASASRISPINKSESSNFLYLQSDTVLIQTRVTNTPTDDVESGDSPFSLIPLKLQRQRPYVAGGVFVTLVWVEGKAIERSKPFLTRLYLHRAGKPNFQRKFLQYPIACVFCRSAHSA